MKKLLAGWQMLAFVFAMLSCFESKGQCYVKNDFTYTMVNCSTIVVTGNPVVVNGQHHWNLGAGWQYNGNIQETYTFPCDGTYDIQHSVESGQVICTKTIAVYCGGFTIEEDDDPCKKDFACFKYTATHACPGETLKWDFGDGTVTSCTNCTTVQHCYTNVNTFTNVNTMVTVKLGYGGQTSSNNLNISTYDSGIFIGDPTSTNPSNMSLYSLVLPGPTHNGNTQGSPVYVYGTVDVNNSFTFSQTDVFIERSGGFNVTPGKTFVLQNYTTLSSSPSCPCLWRGIDVEQGATLRSLQNTTIREALYAVRPLASSSVVGLRGVNLTDNYIGLMAAPNSSTANGLFTWDGNAGFSGNTFSSSQLKAWCDGGDNVPDDPFWPSNSTFSQSTGWAGVYLNSSNFQVPATTTAVNRFSNLANGIFMVNTSAAPIVGHEGVWNCYFENMLREGYPTTIGGHGIYFRSNMGNSLTQEGFGMGPNDPVSFNNCEIGIYVESNSGASSSLESHDNRMLGMEFGYRLNGITGSVSSEIVENEIHSDVNYGHDGPRAAGVWIEDSWAQSKQHAIDNNLIFVDQSKVAFGVFIRGSFDVNGTMNAVSIGNNFDTANNGPGITVSKGTSCVQVVQYGGVDIHNNIMSAQQNAFGQLTGVLFGGGQGHMVRCNQIIGANPSNITIPLFSGVNVNGSLGAIIQDNDITNFAEGITFSANSGNVNLACNDLLGVQNIGLHYNGDAITGFQFDRGNQWLGANNSWGAQHDLPSLTIGMNQFYARINTPEWPNPLDPPGIGQWFNLSQVIPDCPSNDNCQTPPGLMAPGNPSELDNMIAQGNLTTPDGLTWDLEKYLYGRLMNDEIIWQGDNQMQEFISAKQNTNLDKFYQIGEVIRTLFQVDASSQAQLDENMAAMESKHEQIAQIDEAMATAQGSEYETLLAQRQQLEEEIIALTQLNGEIFANLHTARVQQADLLLADNAAINTSAVFEANEQSFFEAYLNTICKDSEAATPSQLSDLLDIANQCPSEGGRAIYWATGLYGQLTGEVLDIQDCAQVEGREQDANSLAKSKETAGFTLSPNPASSECMVNCMLLPNIQGELIVTNILGALQFAFPLSEGFNNVSIGGLPAGTYFITMKTNDGGLHTQKLVVQ